MAASGEQTALGQLGQEATCPLCLDFFEQPMVLSCGHNFCHDCLAQLGAKFSCPQCRARMESGSAYPNRPLANIVCHLKRLRLSEEAHQESSGHRLGREHGKPLQTFCSSEKSLLCPGAQGPAPEKPRYPKVQVMLDDLTAHPWLQCDTWRVTWASGYQECPDVPERFDWEFCVLGREGFTTGSHWWEVQVDERADAPVRDAAACWAIGVAKESIRRKGGFRLSSQEGIWAVGKNVKGKIVAFSKLQKQLRLRRPLSRLQVRLDYEAGKVQFLDAETEASLHTFRTGPLYGKTLRPFFYLGQEELTIFTGHFAHLSLSADDSDQEAPGAGPLSPVHQVVSCYTAPAPQRARSRKVDVTLDDSTAHPWLQCDTWRVTWTIGYQECPNVPERFNQEFCVLGCEGFTTGSHWWEVEVDESADAPVWDAAACWAIGVARESVHRKGSFQLSPQKGIWAVGQDVEGENVAFCKVPRKLSWEGSLWKLQVRLDYEAGKVQFLNAKTWISLYTFRMEPLYGETLRPFFYLGQEELTIFTGHPAHWD